jgi:protein required for attachment to host cells
VVFARGNKAEELPMAATRIDGGDWVVVCDGAKALILENIGDRRFPNLRVRETYEHANPKTREEGVDAPGRVQSSVGTARSAVEQTDWHDQNERGFLTDLARRLDRAAEVGATGALIIVAPPRALGMLRKAYTPKLRSKIRAEVERDLVNVATHEIEARLAG